MNHSDIVKYYSQSFVQKALALLSKDREIACSRDDGSYLSRPDTILYPQDVLEKAKIGAATFHCSVEKWKNPSQLGSQLSKKELDELRIGWDLIIDIDAKAKIEHAKIAAIEVCDFLKGLGINPSVKFSGRRGFHICVSKKAFPERVDFKPISKQYPEIPQVIAGFLREKIRDRLLEKLIDFEGGVAALSKTIAELKELSPYEFIDIEQNWGSRHLFRMPYSLHHKTWLVSLPIRLYKIDGFKMEDAEIERVRESIPFLENKEGEGTELLLQALNWKAKEKKEETEVKVVKKKGKIKAEIPEEYFPACIKNILEGIADGKKRSVFTLAAFLQSVNWPAEKIEKRLMDWNEKNPNPLSERMIRTQLKWHERKGTLLPANCGSDLFYKSMGVCKKDIHCGGLKNPVNYAFKKYLIFSKRENTEAKGAKRKKTRKTKK